MARKSVLVVDNEKSQREIFEITMKGFRLFIVSLIAVLIFSALAFAQTDSMQIDVSNKVGFIDSNLFYNEDAGIKELVIISNQVRLEFKSKIDEVSILADKMDNMFDELKLIEPQTKDYKVGDFPFYDGKIEQLKKIIAEYSSKAEELESSYNKRKSEAEYSIRRKIARGLRDFMQEKGYMAIVDTEEIKNSTLTIIFEDTPDITREFINFYNSLPTEQQ